MYKISKQTSYPPKTNFTSGSIAVTNIASPEENDTPEQFLSAILPNRGIVEIRASNNSVMNSTVVTISMKKEFSNEIFNFYTAASQIEPNKYLETRSIPVSEILINLKNAFEREKNTQGQMLIFQEYIED